MMFSLSILGNPQTFLEIARRENIMLEMTHLIGIGDMSDADLEAIGASADPGLKAHMHSGPNS